MESKIVLEITPASVSVLDLEEGTSKYIDPSDLLQLISISNEGIKYRMGALPDNIVDIALEEPGHKRKVLLFFPKGCFDFKAQEKDYKGVEFPSLLFLFMLEGKKITSTKVVALKGITDKKNIKPQTKIYRYPFTHIYDNFSVCWGSNVLPAISSLHQLNGVPYIFVNSYSAVNHNAGNYVGSNKMNMKQLLTALGEKKINIDDYLLPTDYTYAKFCNEFMGDLPITK